MNLNDELAERRRLAELTRALRERGREMRLAKSEGERDAIKTIARLLLRHRFLAYQPIEQIEAAMQAAVKGESK